MHDKLTANDIKKMQEELDAKTYSASAGGGVVTAEVNGREWKQEG